MAWVDVTAGCTGLGVEYSNLSTTFVEDAVVWNSGPGISVTQIKITYNYRLVGEGSLNSIDFTLRIYQDLDYLVWVNINDLAANDPNPPANQTGVIVIEDVNGLMSIDLYFADNMTLGTTIYITIAKVELFIAEVVPPPSSGKRWTQYYNTTEEAS